MKKSFQKEEGQGLVEYGLIVALVAVVVVLSLSVLSGTMKSTFASASGVLADSQPLTSLGSDFAEISSNMIAKIMEKFLKTGSYGRTWGDFAYTDIGLVPSDWANPIDHIYYKPGGSTLRIRPENGFSVVVKDVNGSERTLRGTYNWDLIYSDTNKKWYYHTVSAENEINIETLVTVKDK